MRSVSSKMARCSVTQPRCCSASSTLASVFQSSVFNSSLRSWSSVVGRIASNKARTFSFFFTRSEDWGLLRAFESAGEQIIHHQRGDVGGHLQVHVPVGGFDVEAELVAAVDQPAQEFVHAVLSFVRPLAD